MAQTYDLILKGGTVVNHDGEGVRDLGLTHKEDLETGSRGAVLGGVTAIFEMPNTEPATTSAEALADKVKRGHHRMHCDFAFYVGATRENTRDLVELERLPGACGVK